MNTAIRGGHDLRWKLAWVGRGGAGVELLDSYELEHRPVAEHNVARSADELGSRRPSGEELRSTSAGAAAWREAARRSAAARPCPSTGSTR